MLKESIRFVCFTLGLLVLMAVSACGDSAPQQAFSHTLIQGEYDQ